VLAAAMAIAWRPRAHEPRSGLTARNPAIDHLKD
jgi:hypothetical protein